MMWQEQETMGKDQKEWKIPFAIDLTAYVKRMKNKNIHKIHFPKNNKLA